MLQNSRKLLLILTAVLCFPLLLGAAAVSPAPAKPAENVQSGITYAFTNSDRGKFVTFSNAGAIAVTIPQAGSTFPNGWYADLSNRGAGTVTITPTTSTIDGSATATITTGQSLRLVSNGTNYITQRGVGVLGIGGSTPFLSGCWATASLPTYVEGTLNALSCTLSGFIHVSVEAINVLISGEYQGTGGETSYLRVNGGMPRTVIMFTGVTTNSTSVAIPIFSGGKTGIAQVSGTGAVAATLNLYGDNDTTTTNGFLVCGPIVLTATTVDVDKCPQGQWTEDYPNYYAVLTGLSGTGATVEFIVVVGAVGSTASAGGGGAVTNAGTFAVQDGTAVGVEDAAETAGGNLKMAGTVRRDVAASSAGATGENATLNTDAIGQLWTRTVDPCSGIAKTHIPINIVTATTTELTPSLSGASTFYYVCSIDLVTAGANNVALVDDNTDGCGSVTAGLAGGTTAGTGWNFAANGGMTKGNGNGTVFKAVTSNAVLCLVTSAAVQLSGSIQVVAAP